ncbi:branched-chain amino acid ABC transporter substrate-binding protein [Azospirillum thiophilum]|uniref:Branched-chain amino acid ABC transporter substrate-binding protein n=2 Tax=Azospirillum thiophilum TaxID=528244 RepID=A0AAC8ZVG1_9PROT|nr:branched-chain amino acid ABC transporter substrate-binding protein [Azospirillum thiophilum]KJR63429.1 branched-chain amino acid ABC transporter substrate-binding protein [Azospirillum thiophilum]
MVKTRLPRPHHTGPLITGPLIALTMVLLAVAPAMAQDSGEIRIGFLSQTPEPPPSVANPDEPAVDDGLAGAALAIADNNTTGKFLKQSFLLDAVEVVPDGDAAAALRELAGRGNRFVIVDAPGATVEALSKLPEARNLLLLNATAPDDSLRGAACAPNLLNVAPSRAMLADALGQYLVKKRWPRWFLVTGRRPEDMLFASAVRRAAKHFGAQIVAEKTWTAESDVNRTAEAEIPVFTQAKSYDVLVVADEVGEFGDYLPYRTADPRPVAGTQGLVPTVWHRTHEQWGAAQLQSRFKASAKRAMTARDHNDWTAVRIVGEAAARARTADPDRLIAFIQSPDFTMSAFRGAPLSLRPWDGQLRQPVLLAADRSLVSVSPQEGFLHPRTELDSLGYDQPETLCKTRGKKTP